MCKAPEVSSSAALYYHNTSWTRTSFVKLFNAIKYRNYKSDGVKLLIWIRSKHKTFVWIVNKILHISRQFI